MAEQHHYFFAVKLPYEVKSYLHRWVQMHEAEVPFKRWVHPEDYHITLAFLGFAEKEMLEKVIVQVGELLKNENAFELILDELGTFGPSSSPRIFWAGVKMSDELMALQKKVYKLCIEAGFKLDKKPFKAHITMARKWVSDQPFDKSKLTTLRNNEQDEISFSVDEIALYETHLDQSPKYHEYALYQLKTIM